MHKKSFTFGAGVGILLMTALFFFLYGYQKNELIVNGAPSAAALTEQEIIDRAKKLGMAFYIAPTPDEQTQTSEPPAAQPEQTPQPTAEASAAPQAAKKPQTIAVYIPENSLASSIAAILFEQNVIDDQDGFVQYLKENNSTKALMYGDFVFPPDADYDEILSIIKGRRASDTP